MFHDWRIDDREVERHLRRRGSRHAFTDIAPTPTALVVIDLIPFFTDENPFARGVVPNVNRLAGATRSAGGTVAWVVPSDEPPNAARREIFGTDVAEMYRTSAGAGGALARLDPDLDAQLDDVAVEKHGASAFFPGACDLHEQLQERGVDTLLVTGTVANVCCESSVRDAVELGYRVVMVADANAAGTDAELNATIHTIYRSFGDVRSTEELATLLGG